MSGAVDQSRWTFISDLGLNVFSFPAISLSDYLDLEASFGSYKKLTVKKPGGHGFMSDDLSISQETEWDGRERVECGGATIAG